MMMNSQTYSSLWKQAREAESNDLPQTARQFLKLTKTATSPKNCAKVQADVLLVQAGKDTMVNPGGQETFLRQIGSHGRLFRMDHAKHEIYLGTDADLQVYWNLSLYRQYF